MSEQTEVVRSAPQRGVEAGPVMRPAVDIVEKPDAITLIADLPGVSSETLSLKIEGNVLTIEGDAAVQARTGMEQVYTEARIPRFRRSFTLSRELSADGIDAALKDGVLRLRIPKGEAARPRRIDVKVS